MIECEANDLLLTNGFFFFLISLLSLLLLSFYLTQIYPTQNYSTNGAVVISSGLGPVQEPSKVIQFYLEEKVLQI